MDSHPHANSITGALRPEGGSGSTHASGATATALHFDVAVPTGCRQGMRYDRATTAGQKARARSNTFKTNVTVADMTMVVSQRAVTNGLYASTSVAAEAGDVFT